MSRLLTPTEVAELLSVKLGTIYNWVHIGYIPHVKLGKLVRFREGDVLGWLEKRSRKGRASRHLEVI